MKGTKAEDIARERIEGQGWMVHHAKPYRVRFGHQVRTVSNDIWGCIDLLCIRPDLGYWFVQVTTKAGVSARRRKIEQVPWPSQLEMQRISILEAVSEQDPNDGRRKNKYFIIHDYDDHLWTRSEETI